eukprot:gene3801-4730_t
MNIDRQLLISVLFGGGETSSQVFENFIMCMVNNPMVQKKAYNELIHIVGKGNRVKLGHRQSTPYINALIKELIRYISVTPLNVPRLCPKSTILENGLLIPKGYHSNPFQFDPERFINEKSGASDSNIGFIPFGLGSKNCIGQTLAKDELYIVISNLLMNFEIGSIDGKNIDETECTNKNEPKGVGISLPFIGNMYKFGKYPQRDLLEMIKKNGNGYIQFWMGDQYTVFICDPALTKELWVKQIDILNSRPFIPSFKLVFNNYANVVWYDNRQMIANLFTSMKIKQISNKIIEKEISNLMDFFNEKIELSEPKYFKASLLKNNFKLFSFIGKFLLKLIVEVDKVLKDLASGRIDDFIEVLRPISYYIRKNFTKLPVDTVLKTINGYYENHKMTLNPESPRDGLDSLILESEKLGIDKSIVINSIFASGESLSQNMENMYLCLINYPEVQTKAYEELIRVVGKGNNVTKLHRPSTPYINAMIKEVLRYRTVIPINVPRTCTKDITANGILFPKGASLIQFVYGMNHINEYHSNPEIFNPDRFLNIPDENSSDSNNSFIPFGIGPRNCIGKNLAIGN